MKDKQQEYEERLIARFGEGAKQHIEESKRRVKGWSKEDWERVMGEFTVIVQGLVAALQKGSAPGDASTQALIRRHYEWLRRFWTPNRESYTGHGAMLADTPEWRAFYEPYHPKVVDFMAAAIKIFADCELK